MLCSTQIIHGSRIHNTKTSYTWWGAHVKATSAIADNYNAVLDAFTRFHTSDSEKGPQNQQDSTESTD